jgi:hypothetical protein
MDTNKYFRTTFIATLFSLTLCGQAGKDSTDKQDETKEAMREIKGRNWNVSLVNLIANPEKYHGQTIQVEGYLKLEFESNAIYLHEEDCKKGLVSNGFWVEFSNKISKRPDLKKYSDKYVIIIGTFDMNSRGHMGLFAGTINNIRRLDHH